MVSHGNNMGFLIYHNCFILKRGFLCWFWSKGQNMITLVYLIFGVSNKRVYRQDLYPHNIGPQNNTF